MNAMTYRSGPSGIVWPFKGILIILSACLNPAPYIGIVVVFVKDWGGKVGTIPDPRCMGVGLSGTTTPTQFSTRLESMNADIGSGIYINLTPLSILSLMIH